MPTPHLALTPDVSHGPPDGARWPRCDAPELELPSLAGAPARVVPPGATERAVASLVSAAGLTAGPRSSAS
ncbi:hypothetical protein ACFYZB_21475 [Streptomyces sp. NPDC001852]|uniref:hypothetical protein n=1 Tax=Streptomyces sp. NPDC001852 TaxID=3364619 RepID=UPI0036D01C17